MGSGVLGTAKALYESAETLHIDANCHARLWKDDANKKYTFYETAEILVRHELIVSGVGLVLSECWACMFRPR